MYTLGIDIGSTTSKCAVLKDGEELVATSLRVGGMGTEGPQEALDDLWAAPRAASPIWRYARLHVPEQSFCTI